MTTISDLVGRLDKMKRSGRGYSALCPCHDDKNPSLSVREMPDGGLAIKCFSCGATTRDVLDKLGLRAPSGRGLAYTLSEFADAKRLSSDFLSQNGLCDGTWRGKSTTAPAVEIPYRDESGEIVGRRYRTRRGTWNAAGEDCPHLYGADRLAAADPHTPVYIVEGESDCLTLWNHDKLAVGLPGAGRWRSEWADRVNGRPVIVWREPGDAGERMVRDVTADLPSAKVLRAPSGAKDPSELHCKDPDAFQAKLDELTAAAEPAPKPVAREWHEAIPLVDHTPASLRPEMLPHPLRGHCVSVSAATQTPLELAVGFALASVATCVANKARIRVRDYHQPLVIFTGIEMEAAGRKSPVRGMMIRPIEQYEERLVERVKPIHLSQRDKRDILEEGLKRAKRKAATVTEPEAYAKIMKRVTELRDQLSRLHVPPLPRLLTEDVTYEKVAVLMSENDDRIGIIAAEAAILSIMAGRYSDGRAQLDVYKQAWTGDESIRVDRMGREALYIRRPAITIGLAFQPTVLRGLPNLDAFKGEGLLARFLWFRPESRIGYRATGADRPLLDPDARNQYDGLIHRLLELKPKSEIDGRWEPHTIEIEQAALDVMDAFDAEIECQLRPGGPLNGIQAWAGKLLGNTVRVAALLHLVSVSDEPDPFAVPITADAMQRAVNIGQVLIEHALSLFGAMEADSTVSLARYVFRRLNGRDMTKRDLFRRCSGKSEIQRVSDLDPPLEVLREHHLIDTEKRRGDIGRSSEWVLVNPDAPTDIDKTDNSAAPVDPADTADSMVF